MNNSSASVSDHTSFRIGLVGAVILAVLFFIWFIHNTYAISTIQEWIDTGSVTGVIVTYGVFLMFFAHLLLFASVLMILRHIAELRIIGMVTLVLCVVSTIWSAGDFAAVSDIGKEYPVGGDISYELNVLYLGFAPHALFFSFLFLLFFKTFVILRTGALRQSTAPGESLFIALHSVGLVCAAVGLVVVGYEYIVNISHNRRWYVLFESALIMTPYLIVAFYWLIRVIRGGPSGLLDEKQRSDITRSAICTILISLPVMFMMYLVHIIDVNGPGRILWLPYYLYITLFIFSGMCLFFNRMIIPLEEVIRKMIKAIQTNQYIQPLFMVRSKRWKPVVLGVVVVCVLASAFVTFGVFRGLRQGYAWEQVDGNVYEVARAKYPGDKVESLLAYVEDESNPLAGKEGVIRMLGKMEDKRALPLLERLYTGEACRHGEILCQYRLEKSIDKINNTYRDWMGKWLARRFQPEIYGP